MLALIAAFVLVAVISSAGITVTLDEPLHIHYGLYVLQGNTDRIDDSSMPVSALNALPKYIASGLPPGRLRAVLEGFFVARLVTILFAAWLASVVFRWAHALYGLGPAILGALLFILDPNILANAQLVTTDIFAAGMLAWSLYHVWQFARTRTLREGLAAAVAIGLSQLVKYTSVVLLPLCALVLLAHDVPEILKLPAHGRVRELSRYLGRLAAGGLLAAAIVALILNLGFLLNRTMTPLSDYRFRSELFRSVQESLRNLGPMAVPVPYPYLEGLDWMRQTEQSADRYGNVYLLGRLSKPLGFPGYFFVASALKVPIATNVILILAAVAYLSDPGRRQGFRARELFLLLPVAILAIYFNFFFNAQTGMRYYLVLYPLLYVFGASLLAGWSRFKRWQKLGALGLIGYLAASVFAYFPHFTPYFNELVPDKTQTYRYLADTNLDWGQSKADLNRYLAAHPEAVYNPSGPQAGHLVVGGSDLVGILEDPDRYAWLRDNFEPRETISFSYFVYRISPQEVIELCATTDDCD